MSATQLAKLSKAVQLLSEARTLDEITHVRAMAQAAEEYARAEKLGDEAERYAREVRVRAARKAGELLIKMAVTGERYVRQPGVDPRQLVHRGELVPTLASLGVTRKESSRWQALAAVPEEVFEDRVNQGWGEGAIARGSPTKPVGPRKGPLPPKAKTNGATLGQSLRGLQQAAVQLQGLAEALDGHLLGDWSRLYQHPDADPWFRILEESLPVVSARVKRILRERRGHAA